MWSDLRAFSLAALALAFAAVVPAHAAPGPSLAAPDPRLVQGVLSNGLRYLILPNRTPPGAVSLRFYVRAGAEDETETERGAAHFVEHMAFEGSGRFPRDSLDKAFADAGVSAARDQNAFTDAFGTDYVFDLQAATPAKLDLAFAFLRAAADDLSFDPAAVDREKGVVLAEISARKTGGTELSEFISRFFAPGLLAPRRPPGGTPQSVGALDAAALRAFHDRWYRPERALMVVAGDAPVEETRARIVAAFGSWRAKGPAPTETDTGRVDPARPAESLAVTTPNFAQGSLQICRVAPRDPVIPSGAASVRREALDAIWLYALNERLTRLARAPDAPFATAGASRSDAYHAASLTCLNAAPKPDRWSETVRVLVTEARRLALHGVQEAEADRARRALGSQLEEGAAAAGTRPTDGLARLLLATALDGQTFTSPGELSRLFAAQRAELTAQAATEAFRARLAQGARITVLDSLTAVNTTQLDAALAAAEQAPPPAAPPVEAAVVWPYADFGPAGRVKTREEIVDPGFTRVTFADGVVLNFKHTEFQRGVIQLRVSLGEGQAEIPRARLTALLAGVETFGEGGLGKLDAEGIQRALEGRIWGLGLASERTHLTLAGSTRPQDLRTQLQVLAAAVTEPGFRPEAALRMPDLARSRYKDIAIEPVRVAQQALHHALPQPHPYDLPPEAEFAAVSAADMGAALKPVLVNDPLEVTIVGDVDEAQAVEAVAATLAALPPRRPPPPPVNAVYLRYGPAPPAQPLTATHIGLPEKAAVLVTWPLYVWAPERLRETRALTLLREVLDAELRREVRERLGLTYTPQIELGLQRGGDQGALTVAVETSPANADATRAAVLAVAARLAKPGGVDPVRLEEVRRPLLDDTVHRKESNGWWLGTMDGSASNPFQLEMARTWRRDYGSIPAEEVQAAATRWLSSAPWVVVALPKAGPPTAPAGTTTPLAPAPVPAPAPGAPTPTAPAAPAAAG